MLKKAKVILTSGITEDRLTEKEDLKQDCKLKAGAVLKLNPDKTFQNIIGFGGAFTEAAAYTVSKISIEKRAEIIKRYFHPTEGLGYNLGRVSINSCDFSLKNYTYVKENDKELKTFDISHEKEYLFPFIREAERVKRGSISLLASPWSPPAWMKSNSEMNNGGKLLLEYRKSWAYYYVKYIKAMRREGFNIFAITVQNEPSAVQCWESCIYSAEEEGAFIRNYLGPILYSQGLKDVKIYIWDHNRDIIVQRTQGVLKDPETAKYVYGVANHWYVSEEFENLSKVHGLFPDKHILFTEGCQEGGVQLNSWAAGERYGRNMIGDFNNWQEGWLDWNLVLDEGGGPNHLGNYCDAPIIADTRTGEVYYNSSYYYIGHFSRFVKPGAKRIEVNQTIDTEIKHVGFINKDKSVVLIVMNETDMGEDFQVEVYGKYFSYNLKAHSIATFLFLK